MKRKRPLWCSCVHVTFVVRATRAKQNPTNRDGFPGQWVARSDRPLLQYPSARAPIYVRRKLYVSCETSFSK